MIIILEPQKDTYITNLKTVKNDGLQANTGQSATIDLFKLYNENKNSNSWAAFDVANAANNNKITLEYSDSTTLTFNFEDTSDFNDGRVNNDGEVIVGIQNLNGDTKAKRFSEALNNINSNETNGINIDITAFSNSDDKILLKQNKPGESGDIEFTIVGNISQLGERNINKFARIDYSVGLIKFDLDEFKNEWITLINDQDGDGVDDGGEEQKDDLPGAFKNLKAELLLKDVTTGVTKPKDFSLELYEVNKDFKEGVGKDTVHFSDKGLTNFKSFDSENNWEIEGFVSESEATSLDSSMYVKKGDEDLVFDITDYIINKFRQTSETIDDKGLLIKFPDSILYNNKSYFAKRLGSRHLINKKLRPELRIKIDDSSYNIPVDSFNKKRYMDSVEDFYLFNIIDGNLLNFVDPNANSTLKFKIKSKNNQKVYASVDANDVNDSPIVNFKGKKLSGIRKAQLGISSLSKFNSEIQKEIKKGKLEANYEWCWYNEDDVTKSVKAGNFILGRSYKINTQEDNTDFTLVGAANNEIGTVFIATGVGSGDATAYEIEKVIKSERVDFYTSEVSNESQYENLLSVVKISENELYGNNNSSLVEVYFVDTKKEFDFVKTPYEIPSENLGDVFYKVVSVEDNKTLIDFHDENQENATKLFFDGEKYRFSFYVPKKYKGMRINFKFMYTEPISGVKKFIFNEKYSVRVI